MKIAVVAPSNQVLYMGDPKPHVDLAPLLPESGFKILHPSSLYVPLQTSILAYSYSESENAIIPGKPPVQDWKLLSDKLYLWEIFCDKLAGIRSGYSSQCPHQQLIHSLKMSEAFRFRLTQDESLDYPFLKAEAALKGLTLTALSTAVIQRASSDSIVKSEILRMNMLNTLRSATSESDISLFKTSVQSL